MYFFFFFFVATSLLACFYSRPGEGGGGERMVCIYIYLLFLSYIYSIYISARRYVGNHINSATVCRHGTKMKP